MKKILNLFICLILLILTASCDDIVIENQEDERYDIYLLAQEAGYKGTYEEWLESIKGEKGEDGHSPVITIENGYWYIDGVNTNVLAEGNHIDSPYTYASNFEIYPGKVNIELLDNVFNNNEISNKTLIFSDGTYVFSNTINIPSNWRIEGSSNTIFKLDENSLNNTLINLFEADNVKISNLKLEGYNTSKPSTKGNTIGISVVKCRSINLSNLDIVGFSDCGIYSKTMSSYGNEEEGAFYKQMQIDNCRFYYNYYGTYFDYRCEYTQTNNCVFGENYVGSLNAGGNNIYI